MLAIRWLPGLALAAMLEDVAGFAPYRSARIRGAPHAATPAKVEAAELVFDYHVLDVPTASSFQVIDMTERLQKLVDEAGITDGAVNVMSKHTTTALTINEYEHNLLEDMRRQLLRFAPASAGYLHDNIEERPSTPEDAARVAKNFDGTVEEWRDQEPKNTHSHLCAMMLGSSEVIPVTQGKLALGTWQSLMMVELDGPRKRTLAVQVTGTRKRDA